MGQLTRLLNPQQGTDLLQMLTAKGVLSKQETRAEVAIPSILAPKVPPPNVRPDQYNAMLEDAMLDDAMPGKPVLMFALQVTRHYWLVCAPSMLCHAQPSEV